MVNIRSANEIILSLIDFFRLAQPDLDVKPGTVARDLFIDAPAAQLSLLYDELSGVSNKQSLRLVIGSDLDKLAKNFGLIRKQSTPSTGVSLLTFSSVDAPIAINRGGIVIANNGFAYAVSAGLSVSPASANLYRSIASKFRDQLDLVGISDEFAIEATVQATTPGFAGNIGPFALSRTTIPGVSNCTNINAFSGGTDQESDVSFRNRILSSFSGSSVGTSLGYLNTALSTNGVIDAAVIEPGDPLMTRDGTVVKINTDGSRTIISEGSGGKVDVVVLGNNLIENRDSFIYRDKSNNNDPSNSKNDVVLGQIVGDENKTINRKRIDNIKAGVLPAQPVNEILEVTGSISGSNFLEKTVDELGRVSGNYELLIDTGVYGGSPWGFDTFHWISDRISLFNEDRIKGQFNGQDATTFTDVVSIPQLQQNISITNENSLVSSDRSIIQLLHTPATNVTRVVNVNTGERYIITNQNFDRTGTFNETGRIQISGNTLPSPSDVLQVDYIWIVSYDQYSDYDGLENTANPRPVSDSVDWGYASVIRNEEILFAQDAGNNFFIGTASHPVSTILTANSYLQIDGVVETVSSGTFINRLSVKITNLASSTQIIDSIVIKNTNTEVYNTAQADGVFSNITIVVGIELLNETTIILPTDTVAVAGNRVSVIINSTNVFTSGETSGSVSGAQITIPSALIDTAAEEIILRVSYIANVSDLFSSSTTSLPTSRVGNGFILTNNNGFNNFSPVNISRRENQIIQQNTSNQILIELTLPSADFTLTVPQIICVIRLSDGLEIWNENNPGTIITGTSGNYQLVFSGLNTPLVGDRVIAIYYATDIRRFQPFSYSNYLIKTDISALSEDVLSGQLSVPLNSLTTQMAGLNFSILEPNTDIVDFTVSDGYLIVSDGIGILNSLTVDFSSLADLTNKKVKITNALDPNNDGIYDILGYDVSTNEITITNVLENITKDQISVIKLLDGQEIWNYSGTIDTENNLILLPESSTIHVGDKVFVMIFRYNNLRQSPTKLIGTTVDQVVNSGVVTASGTTLTKAEDIIFTATNTGLRLNLSEAVRKALGLSSAVSIPSNIRLAKIAKLEKVVTASITNDEVLQVLSTYDLKNTTLQNNLLYVSDFLADDTLQNLEFILPNTTNNTNTLGGARNLPTLGDKIRATFYFTTDGDTENLSYTRNGTLYTNKKFVWLNKIFLSSGFKSSQSTRFTATSFTQPSLGSRYKVFYDYLAPKQNERIVVRYNYNKLIADTTFNLENTRPINADVLARQAKLVLLDLTMNVVITDDFKSSTTTVLQNLRDKLLTALTTNSLGEIVDTPTLINVAQSVAGIARARILYFNKTGGLGTVLKVQAQEDEYFNPNNVFINTETR